jgi:MFS transporter, putative metabolite:H+ symporter
VAILKNWVIGTRDGTRASLRASYGFYPRSAEAIAGLVSQIRVRALDEASIRTDHIALLIVIAVAVTIDVMRPTTLAFVVPGMAQESELRAPLQPAGVAPVAYLPLWGTVAATAGAIRESEAGSTLPV